MSYAPLWAARFRVWYFSMCLFIHSKVFQLSVYWSRVPAPARLDTPQTLRISSLMSPILWTLLISPRKAASLLYIFLQRHRQIPAGHTSQNFQQWKQKFWMWGWMGLWKLFWIQVSFLASAWHRNRFYMGKPGRTVFSPCLECSWQLLQLTKHCGFQNSFA